MSLKTADADTAISLTKTQRSLNTVFTPINPNKENLYRRYYKGHVSCDRWLKFGHPMLKLGACCSFSIFSVCEPLWSNDYNNAYLFTENHATLEMLHTGIPPVTDKVSQRQVLGDIIIIQIVIRILRIQLTEF